MSNVTDTIHISAQPAETCQIEIEHHLLTRTYARKLDGRRVLVVGGSSGIGLATARAASEEGALVTIASRSDKRLRAALAELPESVCSAILDIGDDQSVENFFAGGELWDHVVVSGAETPMGRVHTLSMVDAQAAMNSKFWGTYRVARLAPIAANGSITFVSGMLSVRPRGAGVQSAINAAIEALGRALALEIGPIRVNTVSPGLIVTPLWQDLSLEDREAMYQREGARLPAGRVGTSEEVAEAIMLFMKNGFATASTIYLDGGALVAR